MNTDLMTTTQLQHESARIEALITEMDRTLADLRNQLQTVRGVLTVRLRPAPEPRCSEHALLRYIERTRGVDVDAARSEIMTDDIKVALRAGVTAITVKGIKMVCRDGVVVTVLTNELKNAGKHKRTRPHEADEDEAA